MYKASIENRGDSRLFAATRHSTFVMDKEGHGANPVDTLLASLCGCLGLAVREFQNREHLGGEGFSIEAFADVTANGSLLDTIQVRIDLGEAKWSETQRAALLEFVGNCKVNRILREVPGVHLVLAGQHQNAC